MNMMINKRKIILPIFVAIISAFAIFGAHPGIASAELVGNGGFENGLNSWTLSSDPMDSTPWVDSSIAHTGSKSLAFYNSSDAALSQTISTVQGSSYIVTFWLKGANGPGSFTAKWGDTTLVSLNNPSLQNWTSFSYLVTGSGSDKLTLVFNSEDSPRYLDDVSVTRASTVPVPGAVWLLGSGLLGLAELKRRFIK